jgi:hypothetical protein
MESPRGAGYTEWVPIADRSIIAIELLDRLRRLIAVTG